MAITTQAIETKYLRATNVKGARIKASAWGGSVTIGYPYELDAQDAHRAAADALIAKLGWTGTYAQGGNAKGDGGYYFVNVEGAPVSQCSTTGRSLTACAAPLFSVDPRILFRA